MKKQMKLVVAGTSILTLGVVVGAGVLTLGLVGQANAFHSGGVAKCESCHTMHNSFSGKTMIGTTGDLSSKTANSNTSVQTMLLQGTDASSACLNCHGDGSSTSSYHVKTEGATTNSVPQQMSPGGDFSWTMVDCQGNTTRNNRRGHNIVAADFSMAADATLTVAPGGTYPNTRLACSSCHDPHGKYRIDAAGATTTTGKPIGASGSYASTTTAATGAYDLGVYRFLAGVGYNPKSLTNAGIDKTFTAAPPVALAPSTYNTTTLGATAGVRVAYGSGMSEWCANCHTAMHSTSSQTSGAMGVHPASNGNKLGATIAANYNAYKKTGDMTGSQATANLNLVAFETGAIGDAAGRAALTALQATTAGPDATANVMCLSCHRAHASGFESMLRWDQVNNELLTDTAGAYKATAGLNTDQQLAAYYNKPSTDFAVAQRSLCNKCHAKD
ncbi:MAG: hypothetical protein A2505_08615 [Deltaproteobacteria bacterium RIFOXYD12_FULL_55_16]|nr:MAG: hypothetical protein A2505_08615 [Deltaproteobacteria bacterium RIFOXYD12_FULL_55_16]